MRKENEKRTTKASAKVINVRELLNPHPFFLSTLYIFLRKYYQYTPIENPQTTLSLSHLCPPPDPTFSPSPFPPSARHLPFLHLSIPLLLPLSTRLCSLSFSLSLSLSLPLPRLFSLTLTLPLPPPPCLFSLPLPLPPPLHGRLSPSPSPPPMVPPEEVVAAGVGLG
ncbi:hypothetical protein AAC387_Pa06g3159 [Persea americana]